MSSQQPYRLAFLPVENRACVQGDPKLLANLLAFPGVRRHGDLARDGYLSLPLTREAVLALDALGSPVSVSSDYQLARRRILSIDDEEVVLRLQSSLRRPLLPHQFQFCAQALPLTGAYNASE